MSGLGLLSKRTGIATTRQRSHQQPVPCPFRSQLVTLPSIPGSRCSVSAAVSRSFGRGSQDDADIHQTKLGPNVIASVKDLAHVKWGPATVVRNDSQSLDGSVRVLHLSVADHVDMLYGRRIQGVPDATRWIESYTSPGQCVAVRLPGGPDAGAPPRRLYAIASSPYASRRDSAYVDASLIEIIVDRCSGPEEAALADLGPGAQLEVSQVIGRGFSSLLDSYNCIANAIEEGRSLVLIGMGPRGLAAVRSALNWQPVMAHASAHGVSALYLARSAGRAACVAEWDTWREAGVRLRPLYTHPGEGMNDAAVAAGGAAAPHPEAGAAGAACDAAPAEELDPARCDELLQVALFASEGGFDGVCGGSAHRAAFCLAGLPGDMAGRLAKQLAAKGVAYEHIMFCDFF